MTQIINLYAGPGCGKSTSAAFLYYRLKQDGVNAELVREYVKDWAWEHRKISTYDQLYLLGKQIRRESLLYGKTDWIVTDSPVLLQVYYARKYCTPHLAKGIEEAVTAFYQEAAKDGYEHYHVMLSRSKPYMAAGRYQTEEEARQIDVGVLDLLKEFQLKEMIPYILGSGTSENDLRLLLGKIQNG